VQVLSDKAYRKSRDNIFEAVGNVIVTQGTNSIYGEKATLSFATGETEVLGNVRYVGPSMTMYGSKLIYNFNNQKLDVSNARILSDNYVVLGRKLSRLGPNEIYGKDAEYTTCRDCPESWSVFGKEVRITIGEYVRIKHAYIKVKGVVVMYIPYMILPIKKARETGVLFPSFGLNLQEGARFQLPFFWAMSDQMDSTITPSIFGNRGIGSEIEFRHTPTDSLWYQVDGLYANDGIYLPGKDNRDKSGDRKFRHLSQWEHHYSNNDDFNHHLIYNQTRDLDLSRDFQFYTDDKILSPDTGLETFFEFRKDFFTLGVEGGYRTNHLFNQAFEFDDRYVQVLPKLSLNLTPIRLFQSQIPGLNKVSLGINADYTIFKQNKIQELSFIRNAKRINTTPYIEWQLGQLGPVFVQTKAVFDYQYYTFPTLSSQNWFRKNVLINESEMSLEFDKIFGLAYEEKIASDRVQKPKEVNSLIEKNIIGSLPSLNDEGEQDYKVLRNSYRHRQQMKLKHYFLSEQSSAGSQRFRNQIADDNGQFDPIDALRSDEFLLNNETSKTTLPLNNTIELQWNNSFIRKRASNKDLLIDGTSLRDNFSYDKVSYFNVSQGYDLYRKTDALGRDLSFKEKLTRLFVDTGFSFGDYFLNFQEYYYYSTQENILRTSFGMNFERGNIVTSLRYNSFRVPVDKFFNTTGSLQLTDLISVQGSWEYDLESKRTNRSTYGVTYSPVNNCWMLQLGFLKTIAEKRFSFNFLINFNDNTFAGLSQE
jgi:LPS-assembly protein